MPANPDNRAMEEIDEILGRIGMSMEFYSGKPPKFVIELQGSQQAITALIERKCKEARINGFRDAQVACSFNENCKNCHANKLTLAYLGEPNLSDPAANNDGGSGEPDTKKAPLDRPESSNE